MRKRLLALTICAVMVSAIAVTTAVSATMADNTNIRQYDVLDKEGGTVVGKLTVDLESGHYVANVNLAKADLKDKAKDAAGYKVELKVTAGTAKETIPITMNSGGELNSQGNLGIDAGWQNGWSSLNSGKVSVVVELAEL